jgi:hypothetical protein
MATLGQYELVPFVSPKTMKKSIKKSPKSEIFISFNIEFKPKTSENHLKSLCFTINILVLIVPFLKTLKDKVFVSFNMEFKLKNFRNSPKIIIFYCCYSRTVGARTFRTPLKPIIKTPKIETFVSFNMEFKLKYYRKSSKKP